MRIPHCHRRKCVENQAEPVDDVDVDNQVQPGDEIDGDLHQSSSTKIDLFCFHSKIKCSHTALHRNPELFHGFVLNGPLIVPGFQVSCAKAIFNGMVNDDDKLLAPLLE